MESEKSASGQKLNVVKNSVSSSELSPVVNELAQKLEQLDGLIRCLQEQQYDFGKKLKQIDKIVGQGEGVLVEGEDSRLEHLNSLTKLAERTLVEADKLAEGMKKEIEENATAECAKIVAKAEDQAKAEAERIIDAAKQRAKDAASEEAQNILGGITEIRNVFEKAYEKVLTNLGETQPDQKSD
jgi:vacuolar-type H+-ATPase subunit H